MALLFDDDAIRVSRPAAEAELAARAGHDAVEAEAIATALAVERLESDAARKGDANEPAAEPVTSGAG